MEIILNLCFVNVISEIKPLEKWNVSNGSNFMSMFSKCSSLSDITPLENWDVSNGIGFTYMFSECSSLSDIKALIKWNVKERFDSMFEDCPLLKDSEIKELYEKWNK